MSALGQFPPIAIVAHDRLLLAGSSHSEIIILLVVSFRFRPEAACQRYEIMERKFLRAPAQLSKFYRMFYI